MNRKIPTGFFAYPSVPASIGETVHTAVEEINRTNQVVIKTWEQCRIGGKVIIQELCKEIAQAELFCAELTGMNANVMFELGYAIAKNKRIWLALDTSYVEARGQFEQLRILTTVGYSRYCNSEDLRKGFFKDKPHTDLHETIFKQVVEPTLTPTRRATLLYLKSRHDNEASNRISRALEKSPIPLITDDPKESAIQPLAWYVTQIYSALGVVCHLTSLAREGARLHNARHALVAGIAFGLGKPLLLLAEGDFLAPIDYRDLLKHYQTATQAKGSLDVWLPPLENIWREEHTSQQGYALTIQLATELKGLRLGDPIAENEADRLVNEYFLETASYREALLGNSIIFVGRKGCGKTANFLKLADELKKDRRNLVCVIKPVAYELQGIVELMKRFQQRDAKSYAVESLWKFLLYSEVANAAADVILNRPSRTLSDDETKLIAFLERDNESLREDFAVRLERSVSQLLQAQSGGQSIESSRTAISEALHQGVLKDLRILLGKVLSTSKARVAILVDNLDKAWDKDYDLNALAEFFLGLLSTAPRIPVDFRREDSRRDPVNVTLIVFLRSDIFYRVMKAAREPDKIRCSRIAWDDRELLLRMLEERYVASHEGVHPPSELWVRYFCPSVGGIRTQEYLTGRVLPRPRDLLFFVNAAVATAVNRGHGIVEENDILEAEKQYSQYALESILVENGGASGLLESTIYEFVGCRARLSRDEVESYLTKGCAEEDKNVAIDRLCTLTFLGVEVGPGDFRFAEDPDEYRKNLVLARKCSEGLGGQIRYMVNRPFWAFLEITDGE